MSAFSLLTAGLACLATVSAYHAPTGDSPSGNPIVLPGSGSVLPVGQDYTVQWTPTTNGTVSLLLLKGPANNLEVVGPIADSIDNSGSFVWKPSTDLTPGPTESTGYGIQLIVDATGQYQYTTQFGISNPQNMSSSASASLSLMASATASSTSNSAISYASSSCSTDTASASATASSSATTDATSSSTDMAPMTSSATDMTAIAPIATASATLASSSASLSFLTSSRMPSATLPAPLATSTGGAVHLKGSVIGVLAVAGAAFFF